MRCRHTAEGPLATTARGRARRVCAMDRLSFARKTMARPPFTDLDPFGQIRGAAVTAVEHALARGTWTAGAVLTALVTAAGLFACTSTPAGPSPIGDTWRGLSVADEDRCSPYDSDDYSYPQSVEARIVFGLGGIYSPYTCETFDSTRETDIEHVVARSEAHDSGLCGADTATRERFARDLRNLTLASPGLNRDEKGAKDAAEWLPERNRCWFALTVVNVRLSYGLTIDRREAAVLERILSGCSSTGIRCDP